MCCGTELRIFCSRRCNRSSGFRVERHDLCVVRAIHGDRGVEMSTVAASTAPSISTRVPLYRSLFVQILAALALGIVLGVMVPDFAVSLKILSDAFLKL